MSELTSLPNITVKLAKLLAEVEITTVAQLSKTGSRSAWLRLLAKNPST
ncbi:MAG: TfoX/Sxy family protein [Symbiobacteriaceae bacterium]|nr:TfoX/Sxy family protein [Symbiobacteriaceae bacterium]